MGFAQIIVTRLIALIQGRKPKILWRSILSEDQLYQHEGSNIGNVPCEEFLFADGFDDAIIGVDEQSCRLVYSVDKCIEILSQEMSHDEAVEYFLFNVSGAYMGEKTPVWCDEIKHFL